MNTLLQTKTLAEILTADSVRALIGIFVVVVISILLTGSEASAQSKLAIPNKSEQKAASKKLKEVFGKQLSSRNSEQLEALLATLLEQAQVSNPDDSALHYVVLSKCVEVATKLGNVAVAWEVNETLNSSFGTDRIKANRNLVRSLLKSKGLTQDGVAALYEFGIVETKNLLQLHRYSDAERTAQFLKPVAKMMGSRLMALQVEELAGNSKRLSVLYRDVVEQIQRADSGDANESDFLAAGGFYCLDKGDFKTGLPLLAKGGSGTLKSAATYELSESESEKPESLKRIGDLWWDEAQNHKGQRRDHLLAHSVKHYSRVVEKLKGIERKTVEKRVQEAMSQTDREAEVISNILSHAWTVAWENKVTWKRLEFRPNMTCRVVTANSREGSYRVDGRYVAVSLPKLNWEFLFTLDGTRLLCLRRNSDQEIRGLGTIVGTHK